MELRPRLPIPRREAIALALLLGPLMAGCSGTRFGDTLSRSFSGSTSTAPAGPSPAGPAAAGGQAAAPAGLGAQGPAPARGGPSAARSIPGAAPSTNAPSTSSASAAAPSTPAPGPKPPSAPGSPPGYAGIAPASLGGPAAAVPPAPYRVTLRLPQADPSAPAEGLTRALRAAGVPFEVETIERMSGSASSPTPPAATVRPAPAPRP